MALFSLLIAVCYLFQYSSFSTYLSKFFFGCLFRCIFSISFHVRLLSSHFPCLSSPFGWLCFFCWMSSLIQRLSFLFPWLLSVFRWLFLLVLFFIKALLSFSTAFFDDSILMCLFQSLSSTSLCWHLTFDGSISIVHFSFSLAVAFFHCLHFNVLPSTALFQYSFNASLSINLVRYFSFNIFLWLCCHILGPFHPPFSSLVSVSGFPLLADSCLLSSNGCRSFSDSLLRLFLDYSCVYSFW